LLARHVRKKGDNDSAHWNFKKRSRGVPGDTSNRCTLELRGSHAAMRQLEQKGWDFKKKSQANWKVVFKPRKPRLESRRESKLAW